MAWENDCVGFSRNSSLSAMSPRDLRTALRQSDVSVTRSCAFFGGSNWRRWATGSTVIGAAQPWCCTAHKGALPVESHCRETASSVGGEVDRWYLQLVRRASIASACSSAVTSGRSLVSSSPPSPPSCTRRGRGRPCIDSVDSTGETRPWPVRETRNVSDAALNDARGDARSPRMTDELTGATRQRYGVELP